MRTITTLIAFAWLACSSTPQSATGTHMSFLLPQVQLLRVFKATQLAMQLAPDSRILDGSGDPVGRFAAQSRTVSVGKVEVSLDQVVREQSNEGFELDLPVGVWRIVVATAGDVTVNGERWGRVEGFDATMSSWVRLEALFTALPLIAGP